MVQILGAELLQVADAAAREKGIDREEVLDAMEQAIQRAGRFKYGLEHDIRAEVDRKKAGGNLLGEAAQPGRFENGDGEGGLQVRELVPTVLHAALRKSDPQPVVVGIAPGDGLDDPRDWGGQPVVGR